MTLARGFQHIPIVWALVAGSVVPAGAEHVPGKVVLLVADRLTLEDLRSPGLPHLRAIIEEGSIGLVAPCSAGRKTPESVFASIGAGGYSRNTSALNDAYSADEHVAGERATAAEVYDRRTGSDGSDGVLLISIGKVARANDETGLRARFAALGSAIERAGLKSAAFGNSDAGGDSKNRLVASIAMNSRGRIPIGDVSTRMLAPSLSPTGQASDINKLSAAVTDALNEAALVVVDFGDTARLDSTRESLTPEAYKRYKRQALEDLDMLLARLLPSIDERQARLILASFVPPGGEDWSRLTPVVVYGSGVPSGSLSSATTRTPGLIAGIDLAPYILESVGVQTPYQMMGRVLSPSGHIVGSRQPLAVVEDLEVLVSRSQHVQVPLLAPAAALGILALTAAAALVAFGAAISRGTLAAVRGALVFAISVPTAALLLNRVAPASPSAFLAVVFGGAAAITVIAFAAAAVAVRRGKLKAPCEADTEALQRRAALPMVIVAALTATVALADAFGGGALARFSGLPSFGFRYYGIGNEYMGLAIGSIAAVVIWAGGFMPGAKMRRVLLGIFALAVLAIGFPAFGANAGGAITAVVTFGLLHLSFSQGGFRLRHVAVLLGVAAVLLVAFAIADLAASGRGASHIGESLAATRHDGADYLVAAAGRKMGMNLRQLGTRQGRLALMGASPLIVLFFLGVRPRMAEKLRGWHTGRARALLAVVMGAATALISNDNGILAACLLLAPVTVALFLSLTEETHAQDNGVGCRG